MNINGFTRKVGRHRTWLAARAHLKRFKIIVCGWVAGRSKVWGKKYARNHQTDKNRKWKTRKERRGPLGNSGAIRNTPRSPELHQFVGVAENTGIWE